MESIEIGDYETIVFKALSKELPVEIKQEVDDSIERVNISEGEAHVLSEILSERGYGDPEIVNRFDVGEGDVVRVTYNSSYTNEDEEVIGVVEESITEWVEVDAESDETVRVYGEGIDGKSVGRVEKDGRKYGTLVMLERFREGE